eukprot:9268961-Alexandrium_andersonii.AAC.1
MAPPGAALRASRACDAGGSRLCSCGHVQAKATKPHGRARSRQGAEATLRARWCCSSSHRPAPRGSGTPQAPRARPGRPACPSRQAPLLRLAATRRTPEARKRSRRLGCRGL